jgi:hypothetical protein
MLTLTSIIALILILYASYRDYQITEAVKSRSTIEQIEDRQEYDFIKSYYECEGINNILLGIGPGNIGLWRIQNREALKDMSGVNSIVSTGSHLLTVFIESGVIGFIAYILYIKYICIAMYLYGRNINRYYVNLGAIITILFLVSLISVVMRFEIITISIMLFYLYKRDESSRDVLNDISLNCE